MKLHELEPVLFGRVRVCFDDTQGNSHEVPFCDIEEACEVYGNERVIMAHPYSHPDYDAYTEFIIETPMYKIDDIVTLHILEPYYKYGKRGVFVRKALKVSKRTVDWLTENVEAQHSRVEFFKGKELVTDRYEMTLGEMI